MNLSILSLCISVLGLLVWSVSAALSARNLKNLYYDRLERGAFAIAQVFIDHPPMRPYSFEGQDFPLPAPATMEHDYQRALAAAHHILMYFGSIADQRRRLRRRVEAGDFRHSQDQFYLRSPIMRDHLLHGHVSKNVELLQACCCAANQEHD
jgi:hypothetical protein